MTVGKIGLLRLLTEGRFSPRAIDRKAAVRKGLAKAFRDAQEAGLIQSAGYETSAVADAWLDSPAGRRALEEADHGG